MGIRAFNILMGMSRDKVSILNYEDAIIIKAPNHFILFIPFVNWDMRMVYTYSGQKVF